MIKINLLSTREAKKKETIQMQIAGAVLALLLTGGVIGYLHIDMNNKIEDTKREKNDYAKKLEKLNDTKKAVEKQKKIIRELGEKKKVIKDLEAGRSNPVHLMDKLTDAVPENLYIILLELKGNKLTLEGYAVASGHEGFKIVSKFIENLEGNDEKQVEIDDYVVDGSVKHAKPLYEDKNRIYFYLTMSIKYPAPPIIVED